MHTVTRKLSVVFVRFRAPLQREIKALFKLQQGEIRHESADYVNVITKRCPIAKVDRLNLRFERGSAGQLYDFRAKPAHHLCGGRVRQQTPGQHQLRARSTPGVQRGLPNTSSTACRTPG
jgi:hypothetical protein